MTAPQPKGIRKFKQGRRPREYYLRAKVDQWSPNCVCGGSINLRPDSIGRLVEECRCGNPRQRVWGEA